MCHESHYSTKNKYMQFVDFSGLRFLSCLDTVLPVSLNIIRRLLLSFLLFTLRLLHLFVSVVAHPQREAASRLGLRLSPPHIED